MFERKHEKVATRAVFAKRMVGAVGLSLGLVGPALFIGISGYHWIDNLDWVDALLEASMILGGMGPVDPLHSTAAKLFASFYALFSGLAFIGIASLMVAPFAHRLLHRFHVDEK